MNLALGQIVISEMLQQHHWDISVLALILANSELYNIFVNVIVL